MHRVLTLLIIGVMGLWIVQALAGSTVTSRMIQKHGTQAQVSSAKLVYEIGIATDTKRAYFGYSTGKKKLVNDDDPRLSDQRTPASHSATHAAAGSDPVTPAAIGADPVGTAATVQGNLTAHTGATTDAHGGIVASSDSRLSDARTPTSHGNEKHSATYITPADAVSPATFKGYTGAYLRKNGATAADQIYVSDGVGSWIARAWSWIVSKLGLGTAAYTDSSQYANHTTFANTSTASAAHRALTTSAHGGIVASDSTFGTYTGMWRKTTSGNIYRSGGKVGIGTTTPAYQLHAVDSTASILYLSSGTHAFRIGAFAADTNWMVGSGAATYIGTSDNNPMYMRANNIDRIWISTGNTFDIYDKDGAINLRFTSNNNTMLGGLTAVGTSAAKTLGIADGTRPSLALTNGVQIGSVSGEAYIMPAAASGAAYYGLTNTNLTIPGKITMPQTQTISGTKTLTSGTDTGLFDVALTTMGAIGGHFTYTVVVVGSGTDNVQTHGGYADFVCARNTAGTVTGAIQEQATEPAITLAGTLTENTWPLPTGGTDKCTVKANFSTTGLTSPTMTLKYQLTIHGSNAITQL